MTFTHYLFAHAPNFVALFLSLSRVYHKFSIALYPYRDIYRFYVALSLYFNVSCLNLRFHQREIGARS